MSLDDWLIDEYGIRLGVPGDGVAGAALADALRRALVAAGRSYADQEAILRRAALAYADVDFGEACLALVDRIATLRLRLASLPAPPDAPRSAPAARRLPAAGATHAALRFVALWPLESTTFDLVDDFVRRLAAAGYVAAQPALEADLRQGLGYYRPGEDPLRLRRTVRWLHRRQELRCLVRLLTEGPAPLCAVPLGSHSGRWQVAASLFVDARGLAIKNSQLDSGDPPPDRQAALRNLVPRRSVVSV